MTKNKHYRNHSNNKNDLCQIPLIQAPKLPLACSKSRSVADVLSIIMLKNNVRA
jgi:hypothetical protein